MLKIYISYGSPDDQVTALRLQALAVVNGFNAYVPPAYTRDQGAVLDEHSQQKLREANLILGPIGRPQVSEVWRQERQFAIQNRVPTIFIDHLGEFLMFSTGERDIVIDATDPGKGETELVKFVREKLNLAPAIANAVIALGTIAIGLLMLAPQD